MSTFSDGNLKLTWQSDCAMWLLCLEVVRGRLSLGLGSVALLSLNHLARRPAFCLCSGHTNDVSSQSYFDAQIKLITIFNLEFYHFWVFLMKAVNFLLYWYGLNLSATVCLSQYYFFMVHKLVKLWLSSNNNMHSGAHGESVNKGWLFIHELVAGCLNWSPNNVRPVVRR